MAYLKKGIGVRGGVGAGVTFPTGHVIGQAIQQTQAVGAPIGNNNSTYTNLGLELQYIPKRANTESYLIIDFHTSMSYVQETTAHQMDITMKSVSETNYDDGVSGESEIISGTTGSYRAIFLNSNSGESYVPFSFRFFCGTAGGGMRMPTTKTSWSAGDELYFRLFSKSASGNFYPVHTDGVCTFSITEVLI